MVALGYGRAFYSGTQIMWIAKRVDARGNRRPIHLFSWHFNSLLQIPSSTPSLAFIHHPSTNNGSPRPSVNERADQWDCFFYLNGFNEGSGEVGDADWERKRDKCNEAEWWIERERVYCRETDIVLHWTESRNTWEATWCIYWKYKWPKDQLLKTFIWFRFICSRPLSWVWHPVNSDSHASLFLGISIVLL